MKLGEVARKYDPVGVFHRKASWLVKFLYDDHSRACVTMLRE